ncbi:hypothetical protein N7499_001238 [Penicillium canescens]|uniref:DUF7703 domain-containing protein n=1 Tax=Penicillium canescens TaxID=5083 RepID=A0AAD6I424_PENCN|nr:uncharacterized protein N7446_003623 [Penicillium canescens]KAJ6027780.1 hypothetical protein N7460_012597 [Penicillium canescens]KAJ6041060.1 hypothetical protein N7444_009965 [Penicillium canescens]KAJ6066586.1 hypothetical protein N7446_003623 [Penicillium canescens]KAJ6101608.1 hypothetical protein N7499_001238 [Penicillium canescens]KAJ6174068.1 hypothetical protein N7485_006880 [Penicillium canescens]
MPDTSFVTKGPEGLIGGYQGDNVAIKVAMGILVAIVLYNAVELSVLIFLTFRRYHGLYFWSLTLSTTLGLIPSGLGNLLHFFNIGPLWLSLSLSNFGFYFMIPGQSFVLYSRLHLVLYNQQVLRFILCVIIVNTLLIAVPTSVTTFGTAFVRTHAWNNAYTVVERLQVTWFCVQEFLISFLYIHETAKLLQLSPNDTRRKTIMYELIAINILIILMDVAIVTVEFLGLYYLQVLLKAAIYSIKLKLEFAVLGRLTAIVDTSRPNFSGSGSDYFLGQAYPAPQNAIESSTETSQGDRATLSPTHTRRKIKQPMSNINA